MQITHRTSGLWFAESCRPMISCKRQWPKFCTETLKKFFSNAEKRASRNIFPHFFHANFIMFVLLISNHMVFLVQFGINLQLWVFQKAEISAFWKTHLCKLIPNWRNLGARYYECQYYCCMIVLQEKNFSKWDKSDCWILSGIYSTWLVISQDKFTWCKIWLTLHI